MFVDKYIPYFVFLLRKITPHSFVNASRVNFCNCN